MLHSRLLAIIARCLARWLWRWGASVRVHHKRSLSFRRSWISFRFPSQDEPKLIELCGWKEIRKMLLTELASQDPTLSQPGERLCPTIARFVSSWLRSQIRCGRRFFWRRVQVISAGWSVSACEPLGLDSRLAGPDLLDLRVPRECEFRFEAARWRLPLACGTVGGSCEKKRRFPVDSHGFGRRRCVASASSVKYWQSVEAIRLKCDKLRDRPDILPTSGRSTKRKFLIWRTS